MNDDISDLEDDVSTIKVTDIEKENLSVHVDLSAERFRHLEIRLNKIENKVDSIYDAINESNNSLGKVIISAAATVSAAVAGTIVTLLIKF